MTSLHSKNPFRNVDQESRKPRLSQRKNLTYPEEEHEGEEVEGEEDSEIEAVYQKDAKDDSRYKPNRKTDERPREKTNAVKQRTTHLPPPTENKSEPISTARYMIIRAAAYGLHINGITHADPSTFTPSAYIYMFAVDSMHRTLIGNSDIRAKCLHYNTIASRAYYATLFYIQVLRAMREAKATSVGQRKFLTRFEKEFPLETLPVASPMIPFLENLACIKLDDPLHKVITPSLPELIGTDTNEVGIFPTDTRVQLPCVPALLQYLNDIRGIAQAGELPANDDGILVPPSAAGQGDFLGIPLTAVPNAQAGQFDRLRFSAGWLQGHETNQDEHIRNMIRRMRTWQIPSTNGRDDLTTIDKFLRMEQNMNWFYRIVELATVESKYFKDSNNLFNCKYSTGYQGLIEIRYTEGKQFKALPTEIFPYGYSNYDSKAWTYTAVSRIGATIDEEARIGATTQYLVTDFTKIHVPGRGGAAPETDGPYFNTDFDAILPIQLDSAATRTPAVQFTQIIQDHLLISEPDIQKV
jgi:hypothetical protein